MMKRLWRWLKSLWRNILDMSDPAPTRPHVPSVDEWAQFEQERREEFERALRASGD